MMWSVGAVVLSGLVALPGLFTGPSLDAAVFDVVAWRTLHGATPYVDVWDHKLPGAYFLPWLVEAVAHGVDPWPLAWIAWVLVWGATALVVGLLVRGMGANRLSGPIALVVAAGGGQYLLSLGGGLTEPVATLLAAVALLLAVDGTSARRWFVVGAVGATSLIVSIQLAPAIPAGVILAVHPRLGGGMKRIAAAIVGGGVVALAMGFWLALTGSLPAMLDAVVTYNAAYRAVGGNAFAIVPWTILALIPLIALAATGVLSLINGRSSDRMLPLAAALWLILAAAMIAFEGRFYAHYAVPLLVPLAILGASGLERLLADVGRSRSFRQLVVVVGTLLLLIGMAAGTAGGWQEANDWSAANQKATAVASTIQPTAGQSLLVWGDEPELYRLTGIAPALPYIYQLPLRTPGYADEGLIDRLAQQLAAAPPTFVIDAGSAAPGEPGVPPLLIPRPTGTDGRDLDLLDPLRTFVAEHYRLRAIVEGWPVYELQEPQR
jgi:hypothetical protein